MKTTAEIKARIAGLMEDNRETSKKVNACNNADYRGALMRIYNNRLKEIKILEWVMGK